MSDVLFPGCTIQSRLPFIESAFRFIVKELGIDIKDLHGSTCCMEPVGLRSVNQDAWLSVNGRMHSIASGKRIVTLCEGCDLSLSESAEMLKDNMTVSDVAGSLQFLHENLNNIKKKIKTPMKMKTAAFPGCHCEYVCSKKGTFAMRMMTDILSAIGSDPVRPAARNLCCGGGVTGIDQELDKRILSETVSSFKAAGADAAVTACPFCFMRFDMAAKFRTYHIAEAVAIALGYDDTTKYHLSK